MRRGLWCALALAAACGKEKTAGAGPLDHLRQPTGLAVHHGRTLVISSNSDLTYDEATGGALLALVADPLTAVTVAGALNVHSMGGELAVARTELPGSGVPDAEACGASIAGPMAVFGTRGSNTLNAVSIAADGTLSCRGPNAACGLGTNGVGFGDPVAVTVACGGGRARAYFGYLNGQGGAAWIGELNLADDVVGPRFSVRSMNVGVGGVAGFAYDRDRDRLFMTGAATSTPTPLRWVELSGCTLGATGGRGCTVGSVNLPVVTGSLGLELHGIALAHPPPGRPRGAGEPIRAYLTGITYDQTSAATSGYRTTAFGSVLVVVDLHDDARGRVDPRVAHVYGVPGGAQMVKILPRLPGWPAERRDVVAVVSVDAGALTILDDETGALESFIADDRGATATGAPVLGHQAYGLAVDPELTGSTARLWVGSYADGFLTPISVTLDPVLAATFAGGAHLKITGATK